MSLVLAVLRSMRPWCRQGCRRPPAPTVRFVNGVKYAATSLVGYDYRTPVVPNVMCLAGGNFSGRPARQRHHYSQPMQLNGRSYPSSGSEDPDFVRHDHVLIGPVNHGYCWRALSGRVLHCIGCGRSWFNASTRFMEWRGRKPVVLGTVQ